MDRRTRIFSPSSTEPKAIALAVDLDLGSVERKRNFSLELDGVVRGGRTFGMPVCSDLIPFMEVFNVMNSLPITEPVPALPRVALEPPRDARTALSKE